jgi:hypothetical protein
VGELEELKKQRAELDKKIEMLEYEEFPFKEGDTYWMLRDDGNISGMTYCNNDFHKKIVMQGSAFHKQKEAILEADRRVLLHNFKMFRDKCNGDWKNNFYREQRHHYIDFCNSEDELFTNSTYYKTFELFGYFKNELDCDKAIELFGDEIKRLYVEV